MPYHQSAEDLHIDDEVHAGADDEVVLLDLLAEHDGVNATTTGVRLRRQGKQVYGRTCYECESSPCT